MFSMGAHCTKYRNRARIYIIVLGAPFNGNLPVQSMATGLETRLYIIAAATQHSIMIASVESSILI